MEAIPAEVMEVLQLHDWPGNIRELENIIKRAVIMSTGTVLRPLFGELKRLPEPSLAVGQANSGGGPERPHCGGPA